jgi:DNA-binding beta-propeller fold protein YncE
VADGSRNRRVAVVDMASGAIKRFWGAYGERPDDAAPNAYAPDGTPSRQFGTPVSCAELSGDGMVYVCDQRNNRIQVFRKDGSFVKEKVIAPKTLRAGSVWDIAFSRDPQQKYLYVADGTNARVHIVDRQSLEVLTSFGDGGRYPGQFLAVTGVATDSKGNLYTAETFEGKRVQKFIYKGIGRVTSANQGVLRPK